MPRDNGLHVNFLFFRELRRRDSDMAARTHVRYLQRKGGLWVASLHIPEIGWGAETTPQISKRAAKKEICTKGLAFLNRLPRGQKTPAVAPSSTMTLPFRPASARAATAEQKQPAESQQAETGMDVDEEKEEGGEEDTMNTTTG